MKAHTKGTTGNTMIQKVTSLGSLLGLRVELSNGIAVQTKHKTTIKLTYAEVNGASKLAVWMVLHGEQNVNSSQ